MSKPEKIVAVKGMNDILPADAPLWELFENTAETILKSYGYQKIVTPIVEETGPGPEHRQGGLDPVREGSRLDDPEASDHHHGRQRTAGGHAPTGGGRSGES